MRYHLCLALLASGSACSVPGQRDTGEGAEPSTLTAMSTVDPFIGTDGHGHTYPGASAPFGMVQLSPDTRLSGWDGCSGYHYSDDIIYGFSHTHLSGTGVSDYGDILLMPTVGAPLWNNGADEQPGYRSRFRKSEEHAEAGLYSVFLDDPGVRVDLTATPRCGLHRYWFPSTQQANVIIDLTHRDEVIDSSFEIVSSTEIRGHRRSKAWAQDQHVYFVARFSRPFSSQGVQLDGVASDSNSVQGKAIKAHLTFDSDGQDPLLVKVGISAVDTAGAARNLDAEIPGWDFDDVLEGTRELWRGQLAKIEVEGGTRAQRRVFNTALYHSFLNPNLFMDVDGRYRGTDLKIHHSDSHTHYTVFSLWDTYRATHPLFTIVERERTNDFIRTFLAQYADGGSLPIWELAGTYTGCMIGYHAVPVIADAYAKGIRDYDAELAFEAMVHSADKDTRGLPFYREQGFVPAEQEAESVSKTLEYAYDDWCIGQMAKWLGKSDEYRRFARRGQNYKNVFDPASGFMRAKNENIWLGPFDPSEVNFHFTEANSWQYSLYAPQDIEGLMTLLGGAEALEGYLDRLFEAPSATTGRDQPDITGLIGQYAHGNEPSHHMAYLYSFAGKPWKTQARVREILDTLYRDEPDGVCGNEDCGQMSSWYVLSALGLYSVTPGTDQYVIGTPLFPKATIALENGNTFTIRAEGVSTSNIYIQSARLNGAPFDQSWIDHGSIDAGGELVFTMGPEPEHSWGSSPGAIPSTRIDDHRLIPVPFIARGERAFQGRTTVELGVSDPACAIFYSLDGGASYTRYADELQFEESTVLEAYAQLGAERSPLIHTTFRRFAHDRSVQLGTKFANQYAAGGQQATIDMLRGGADYRSGAWQGYQGVDFEATVNLGKLTSVRRVAAGFLQDMRSWIWMPTRVQFFASEDGREFHKIGELVNTTDERFADSVIREFELETATTARFIRVRAENRATCPGWHPGSGNPCWIFVDEITIE